MKEQIRIVTASDLDDLNNIIKEWRVLECSKENLEQIRSLESKLTRMIKCFNENSLFDFQGGE